MLGNRKATERGTGSGGFTRAIALTVLMGMATTAGIAHAQEAGPAAPAVSHGAPAAQYPLPGGLPNLSIPAMDPAKGRIYFASRACVVCHSVNGVGGDAAPALDLLEEPDTINPFDFITRMWHGAGPMIELQKTYFGEQIELTGEELADILAFLASPAEQKRFTAADIPPHVRKVMRERAHNGAH